jgi:hypothetical protein
MKLSRRDALAALAAAGTGSLAGCAALDSDDGADAIDTDKLETLMAVAETVYPSAVDGVESFVERYVDGRTRSDTDRATAVAEAVETLDEYARTFHDDRYANLSAETRREVLDHMSVDVVDPAPDGTDAERVRHYLVNELLYALYSSPTGASLAGLENPPGHPGGIQSYQEGPQP